MHSSRLGSSMGASVIMLSITHGQRVSKKAGGDVPNSSSELKVGMVYLLAQSSNATTRQERSYGGNHRTTPPYGRELPPGRTRKAEVDSGSLFETPTLKSTVMCRWIAMMGK